jgi:hypothetical protein
MENPQPDTITHVSASPLSLFTPLAIVNSDGPAEDTFKRRRVSL